MDNSQKPFACTIEGCEMTFTNEDHLNWHHKKHDMVLNLGLANKNIEVADQTPTPTRFIRNCEEVGLFQDLQNVNPFDETFKKAIESAKTGSLHVPEVTSNDDTLHTPHIFPHVDSIAVDKYIHTRNDNQSNQLNSFCLHEENKSNDSYDIYVVEDEDQVTDLKNENNIKNDTKNLKNKLKETIKKKSKTPVIVTSVPLKNEKSKEKKSIKRASSGDSDETSSKKQKTSSDSVSDEKAKIREINRAAQLRCRKRKKMQWNRMEDDLKHLKSENAKLHQENQNYKHKIYTIKEFLLKHKISNDNSASSDSDATILTKIEEILNSSVTIASKKNTGGNNLVPVIKQKIVQNKIPITPPVIPINVNQSQVQGIHKPVLIQVMGSVAQLAVSVLPNK